MRTNFKKGFTLIELLVVIAIIGVLSSVVIASLGGSRSKGYNAAVQANLDTIRSQSQQFINENNGAIPSKESFCGEPIIAAAISSASKAGNGTTVCNVDTSSSAWAIQVQFKNVADGYACMDSRGISSISKPGVDLGSNTICP